MNVGSTAATLHGFNAWDTTKSGNGVEAYDGNHQALWGNDYANTFDFRLANLLSADTASLYGMRHKSLCDLAPTRCTAHREMTQSGAMKTTTQFAAVRVTISFVVPRVMT